jgi:hypothetical protein
MQVLLAVCGAAHLPNIARALQNRNDLAGLCVTVGNRYGIAPSKYRRVWIFHLSMRRF